MAAEVYDNWYSGEKPGWHELIIPRPVSTLGEYLAWYNSVVDWIEANVDGASKHSRWKIDTGHAIFRFRHERDYLRFVLRWS